MSNFPTSYDDDTTLPVVNDNITEIGGEAINALRDFAFNTELYLGIGLNGSMPSLAARLGVSINPDGTLNSSTIAALGFVTLPITQDQIANNAQIPESKLMLDHRTADLFNYINDLSNSVNTALGWISTTGVELQPHLLGFIYRHTMAQIDVSQDLVNFPFMDNKFRALRDNSNSYTLVNDINNELLAHQWADGSNFGTIKNVTTNDGSVYPSNFAHTASGIFVQSSFFSIVPQTVQDLQSFAEFVDSSSLFLIGSRVQNLFANGISRTSRSSVLTADGYGQSIIPPTPAIAYLLNTGNSNIPVDDINHGDDIIKFQPSASNLSSNSFDEKFALVKVGDIIRINYGTVEVQFVISEKRYQQDNFGNKTFLIRIAGKNLFYAPNAMASISRPLFNKDKFGVLAMAAANNNFNQISSVIIGNPQGAQALGVGFDATQFDNTHYLLYLVLYPTGNVTDGYNILPAIDVTGNLGVTPGFYDLDYIVTTTNNAFRQAGYNYRFIAYQYKGEFGIMLAEPYSNASFSIISGVLNSAGTGYDPTATNSNFPNNVVGVFPITNTSIPDPLGFGGAGAGIATPPYMTSYPSAMTAVNPPTLIFVPLRQNTYYVNGVETDVLNLQIDQALDALGDGYWIATIDGFVVNPGPNGNVQTTYKIPFDLSTSGLAAGKTLVVQSLGSGSLVDFGRFLITNVTFNTCDNISNTFITVYDAVHAAGFSPTATLAQAPDGYGSRVAIYFNSDSTSFNAESATDLQFVGPFKRHFEIYIDPNRNTYSHERGRINISGGTLFPDKVTPLYTYTELSKLNIVSISPKLKGYAFSQTVTKITLNIISYDSPSGVYSGNLCFTSDGLTFSHLGPFTVGKRGLVTRFYDESNIDYIDIVFSPSVAVSSFTNKIIDFQLFPTLSLDEEIMILATCQLNDTTKQITNLVDARQFGNISEEQLSDSAINFIEAPTRELQENGIIRGFNIESFNTSSISFGGGSAVVNGSIVQIDPETVNIPAILEAVGNSTSTTVNIITWFICVNENQELELIASTDFDPNGLFITTYAAANVDYTRIFYATNPNAVTISTYQIRGTYFNDLILNNKDVTPIAVAVATATNPGSGYIISVLTVKEARRFVFSGYGGMSAPFTFGLEASFRSWDAITTWLDQLNNYASAASDGINSNSVSNTVIIKGHVAITTAPITLNYNFGEVYFEGDGGYIDVSIPTGLILQNNVHFDRMNFNYLFDAFLGVAPNPSPIPVIPIINLGAASSFGVLASSTVTNTGASVVHGDLGLSPGTSVTGFPPGTVTGVQHITDGAAASAQLAATAAFIAGNALPGGIPIVADLGGQTLTSGVYKTAISAGITGTLTLDAQGNPNAFWVFQIGSTLTTAAGNSTVALVNGAVAANVFWLVGSSATLGTNTTFVGTIIAQASITATTGATITGRLLAQTAAVTLDSNIIFVPTTSSFIFSGPGYSRSNLVNSGHGLIYMNVGPNSYRNVSVTKSHFYWIPLSTSTQIDRFSFVNIEMNSPSAYGMPTVLQDFHIDDNTFTDNTLPTFTLANFDTRRATVSIVSTSRLSTTVAGGTVTLPQAVINVADTTGFLPSGAINILTDSGTFTSVFYTGITPTSFTGATTVSTASISTGDIVVSLNAPGAGIKLIDATIRNNVCDKDQLIGIMPASVGYNPGTNTYANPITAAITTIGCFIENNVCGAIAALNQFDMPYDINFSKNFFNFVLDKNSKLNIRGNTCKYISSMDATGTDLFNAFSAISNFATSAYINTDSIFISENTCSWIKTLRNTIATDQSNPINSPFIIKHNILSGYDTAFKTVYLQNTVVPIDNIGISVIANPVAYTLPNDGIIDGNFIGTGVYQGSTVPVTFNYTGGIYTNQPSDIYSNVISNLANNSVGITGSNIGVGSNFVNFSCNVHHNKLYRGSTTWSQYISVDGRNSSVTNNFFDQTTTNGTNDISQITCGGNKSENINQTVYTALSLTDFAHYHNYAFVTTATSLSPSTLVIGDGISFSYLTRFTSSSSSTAMYTLLQQVVEGAPFPADFSINVPLSERLPNGVTITSVKLGIWLQTTGTAAVGAAANNIITLTLTRYKEEPAFVGDQSITDVMNNIVVTGGVDSGIDQSVDQQTSSQLSVITPASFKAATQFVTLSPTVGTYVTGSNHKISLIVDLNFLRANVGTSGDVVAWYFSPVEVKYIW
jgi:hypothetical protein